MSHAEENEISFAFRCLSGQIPPPPGFPQSGGVSHKATDNGKTTSPQVFRFMDLPAELRLRVYRYIPKDPREGHRLIQSFPGRSKTSYALSHQGFETAILRTCKQIYAEAVMEIYKELTLIFSTGPESCGTYAHKGAMTMREHVEHVKAVLTHDPYRLLGRLQLRIPPLTLSYADISDLCDVLMAMPNRNTKLPVVIDWIISYDSTITPQQEVIVPHLEQAFWARQNSRLRFLFDTIPPWEKLHSIFVEGPPYSDSNPVEGFKKEFDLGDTTAANYEIMVADRFHNNFSAPHMMCDGKGAEVYCYFCGLQFIGLVTDVYTPDILPTWGILE